MGLKKVFGQFLGTKHIVTSFEKFHFNFRLKMKDLAGLVGEENKYVTGIFFWLLRILWGRKRVELTGWFFFYADKVGWNV